MQKLSEDVASEKKQSSGLMLNHGTTSLVFERCLELINKHLSGKSLFRTLDISW